MFENVDVHTRGAEGWSQWYPKRLSDKDHLNKLTCLYHMETPYKMPVQLIQMF